MSTYKNIIFNSFQCDIWNELKQSNKPILIYFTIILRDCQVINNYWTINKNINKKIKEAR